MFREGFRYSKAEALLLDLSKRNEITGDLFAAGQPATSEKLMGVLDAVNGRGGGGRCAWPAFRSIPAGG